MSMDVGAVGSNQQVYNQQGYDISKKNEEKLSTKAQGKDTTVIFSNADIERMAVDKKFADEKGFGKQKESAF